MSIQTVDENLGVKVESANVRIGYYTVNRTGNFQNGTLKFSVNLYLEYSAGDNIYNRKCISLDDLSMSELNFESFYDKMKELKEFEGAKDIFTVYKPLPEPEPTETAE